MKVPNKPIMATGTRGSIPETARRTTGAIQHPRRHPDSSKMTTSAQNQDSTSQKQIPTHLKSTKTPTTNVSKQQSKRPTPSDNAHRPTLTRRNTFQDSSSPSTTQNTRVSPNPTLRSSALSRATTQKTGPARKPSSLYTKPVSSGKKRFIYVKKQDIGTSTDATTKEQFRGPPEKVEVSNAYDVPQPEQNLKDQESSINGAKEEEEAIQVGSSNETKADVSVQLDSEPISNPQTTAENDKDVDLKKDIQDVTLAVKTQVTEEVSQVPETVSNNINQAFSDTRNINEMNTSKTDENVEDNPASEVGEINKEPAKTVAPSDKKEAVLGTESEVRESKETEGAQEVGREEKLETENAAAKTQVPKGKKESVVSNDVIEETASKLREQRKNKVKALAGAFEAVISLQEQK